MNICKKDFQITSTPFASGVLDPDELKADVRWEHRIVGHYDAKLFFGTIRKIKQLHKILCKKELQSDVIVEICTPHKDHEHYQEMVKCGGLFIIHIAGESYVIAPVEPKGEEPESKEDVPE